MRSRNFASVALVGAAVLSACSDSATAPEAERADVNAAVSNGERLTRVGIRTPSTRVAVGRTVQMTGTLYFHRGGTLGGNGWMNWSSSNPCVATVSMGKVKGIKAGTTMIFGERGGFADTIRITVTGSGNLDPRCESRYTVGGKNDESNGTPTGRNTVKSGEKMTKFVLFAPKAPLKVGARTTLVSEMWYNRGGRYNAVKWAIYRSTNPSVATVSSKGGVVTGRKAGSTKVISTLFNWADTVVVNVVR